ncbi:oxygen-independent coproporphyrinogen III oxidase [Pseudoxanthomonas sp. SL93]|uniref:oxygen-independent coproporphyrinogen III oxidase n=1 Tax=Pseudoxanthomonas sp. SL93 TaxID=2995142 RepID=UPI00226DF9A0|nr:oxygen-independent coproporphyrinogen III oxidase [Pseudoxanthomonas sp. SL93]WAC64065.1 oxygen-independent coproporphyrinogen III oxidase [Pseudoxanthomonas sp. SL93]
MATHVNPPLFDPDLLRRYDRPGPRYTSYPTAPQFDVAFGQDQLRRHLVASNRGDPARPLSLYVHIPFCSSPCFYCGCNRVITRDKTHGERYMDYLYREFARMAPLMDSRRPVVQLHFGGGTPNFLSAAQIVDCVADLRSQFTFAAPDVLECSIELDPRFVEPGDITVLAQAGFNRASLGVQDFDPAVQEAVNRVQGVEETLAIIDACRRDGIGSVNVDLIYGLPRQTREGFGRTLDITLQARPDRIAVYSYAHLPALFKPQQRIRPQDLPSPEDKLILLQSAMEKLVAAGYAYIGMDHFALPDDELARAQARGDLHRNFMGYTTQADTDLLGFGVSAISHVADSFSQNPRDIPSWESAIDDGRLPVWRGMSLDADDVVRADVIQELMCHGRLDYQRIGRRHGIAFTDYFADALARLPALAEDGLLEFTAAGFRATARGQLLLRVIAMCFDRYLPTLPATDASRFSRTV